MASFSSSLSKNILWKGNSLIISYKERRKKEKKKVLMLAVFIIH